MSIKYTAQIVCLHNKALNLTLEGKPSEQLKLGMETYSLFAPALEKQVILQDTTSSLEAKS